MTMTTKRWVIEGVTVHSATNPESQEREETYLLAAPPFHVVVP